ncbi:MAG: hypothetical protein B6D55_04955 [Candidatus Omnitrophica bacterium 4484_70.2]|nr:MAG: hypothetical protein B6D55_04955 [Candidatus Omnitrophica bacterium 4484_70.2]
MGYEKFFGWAFATGKEILKANNGEKLLKRLIFDIRAEETPGRFLEKLSERITEYKTNTNIRADVEIYPEIMQKEWHADKFYYLKSAILTGFLNALSSQTHGGAENE